MSDHIFGRNLQVAITKDSGNAYTVDGITFETPATITAEQNGEDRVTLHISFDILSAKISDGNSYTTAEWGSPDIVEKIAHFEFEPGTNQLKNNSSSVAPKFQILQSLTDNNALADLKLKLVVADGKVGGGTGAGKVGGGTGVLL